MTLWHSEVYNDVKWKAYLEVYNGILMYLQVRVCPRQSSCRSSLACPRQSSCHSSHVCPKPSSCRSSPSCPRRNSCHSSLACPRRSSCLASRACPRATGTCPSRRAYPRRSSGPASPSCPRRSWGLARRACPRPSSCRSSRACPMPSSCPASRACPSRRHRAGSTTRASLRPLTLFRCRSANKHIHFKRVHRERLLWKQIALSSLFLPQRALAERFPTYNEVSNSISSMFIHRTFSFAIGTIGWNKARSRELFAKKLVLSVKHQLRHKLFYYSIKTRLLAHGMLIVLFTSNGGQALYASLFLAPRKHCSHSPNRCVTTSCVGTILLNLKCLSGPVRAKRIPYFYFWCQSYIQRLK